MSYSDILCGNFSHCIQLAVNKNTNFNAGQYLVAATKEFMDDYFLISKSPEDISEDDISFAVVDLICYFSDNNVDFDGPDLANLLILDKSLYKFMLAMVNGETAFTEIWLQMSVQKQALIQKSLELVAFYKAKINAKEDLCPTTP